MDGIKVIKVELPYFDTIEVIPISDTHIGEEFADVESLKAVVRWVLLKPNRFVILNGDIMNIALKNSKSDVYTEKIPISRQLSFARMIFEPIIDRIIGISPGNHEERIRRETNLDMMYLFAKELGLEDRYADNSFLIFIKFGRSKHAYAGQNKQLVYSIFVWHGAGGGSTSGGTLNKLMKMSDTVIADLYIMGHKHVPIATSAPVYLCDYQNMTKYELYLHFLSTNAYLEFGGYGQRAGYRPPSKHIVSAELNGRKKKAIKLKIGDNQF